MKKLLLYSLIMSALSSCIKNDEVVYKGDDVVEFDATVLNSPAVGVTFPLLTRVPAYGLAVSTSNPSITRTSGTIKFRVNLVGRQSATDQSITYKVVTGDYSSLLDVGPPATSGFRLPAVSGTHFTTSGTLVIPAKSSFGEIEVTIINPGASSTTARYLVLELEGNSAIKASNNFKRMGIQISQS
jgi:hypothetical protein